MALAKVSILRVCLICMRICFTENKFSKNFKVINMHFEGMFRKVFSLLIRINRISPSVYVHVCVFLHYTMKVIMYHFDKLG